MTTRFGISRPEPPLSSSQATTRSVSCPCVSSHVRASPGAVHAQVLSYCFVVAVEEALRRNENREGRARIEQDCAEGHLRPLPAQVLAAARGLEDPDGKIVAMLGAREGVRGKKLAKPLGPVKESSGALAG